MIILTENHGHEFPVNPRAILRYEYYEYDGLPNVQSRVYYLDATFVNVRETKQEIESKILNAEKLPLRDVTTYIDSPNTFLPKWFLKFWLIWEFISMILLILLFIK